VAEPPRRPEPPRREARAETSDDMPTPPPRPRIEAKALPKPEARADKPEARPEKPEETPSRFSADAVRNAIARERPQQRATAAPAPAQTAALGSPTARAERMSPSMWGQLDGYLQEQYRQCWNKFGFDGQTYVPQIRVLFNADGSLGAEPVLANAPGDASERALADSAMRAVRRCDPIRIPPQYAPYHAQWRARTLRFDPNEM
jgi:colicin import membrane protein